MRKLIAVSLIMVGVLLFAGVAPALAQEASAEKAPKPPKPLSVYRVEFAIHESDNGQRVNTRNYMQLVEEGGRCRSRAGASIPVTGPQGPMYMDVGFNLDCELSERDGLVRMELALEISSFAQDPETKERPLLRRIRSEVNTAVVPGKPTVVSSIDDTASKRRYELEVTATKVK